MPLVLSFVYCTNMKQPAVINEQCLCFLMCSRMPSNICARTIHHIFWTTASIQNTSMISFNKKILCTCNEAFFA